jgi:hypothetical protein
MNKPQVNLEANMVNPTWIFVTWSGIADTAETGGDDPVFYELSWD